MDLSGLKWPIIIAVVVFLGWLCTSGGVNWMLDKASQSTPGQNAEQDVKDEARLTQIAGFVLWQFQYEKAARIMEESIARYDVAGANFYYNHYRLVKCYEKLEMYDLAHERLQDLMFAEAWLYDERVPERDNLALRAEKLRETHEL